MISFTGALEHYIDHLAPIWKQTGGPFFVPSHLLEHAQGRGIEATPYEGDLPPLEGTVVVAALQDHRRARECGRPVVFMSHGNGQGMQGVEGYTGGQREGVVLFLAPNVYAAELWEKGNPGVPIEVVGCPKLDEWPQIRPTHPERVCISFHWNCRITWETKPAWMHYRNGLAELQDNVDLVAHVHPRVRNLEDNLAVLGIPFIRDFEDVVATCGLYINDCSSTLYEFAALDRPVVVMNAPWYRREVEHGLRFWEYADVGPNTEGPEELLMAVRLAQQGYGEHRRREIVRHVYPFIGSSAKRAAQAIREII